MQYQYTRILGALDNTPFDKHIMGHLEVVQEHFNPGCVLLAHVDPFDAGIIREQPPELRGEKPLDHGCGDLVNREPGERASHRVVHLSGQPEHALAECVKEEQIDLVLAGLQETEAAPAHVGRRLLCMTDADVLFVTPSEPASFERILVPVDLSNKSRELVETVINRFPNSEIHIYFVNYIPSPIVMDEADRKRLIEVSSKNLEVNMQHFAGSIKSGQKNVSFEYGMSEHFNAGYSIHDHAESGGYHLIALGRLSKLDKELPFLGSVTEKLLSLSKIIPVLVVNH